MHSHSAGSCLSLLPALADFPTISRAACSFSGTNQNPGGASLVSGWAEFEVQPSGAVEVKAYVIGLSPGGHNWHVHQAGDISAAADASATLGHFIGDAGGVRAEVGALGVGRIPNTLYVSLAAPRLLLLLLLPVLTSLI